MIAKGGKGSVILGEFCEKIPGFQWVYGNVVDDPVEFELDQLGQGGYDGKQECQ